MDDNLFIDIVFICVLTITPIIYFVNSANKKKKINLQNRHAFAGYILATYKALDCYNINFEKENISGHLHILTNWKKGAQHFRYAEDEEFFNNFIEFTERNELPLSNSNKHKSYQNCAYLFLLNVLISSYCFFDCSAPINASNEALYFELIELCQLPELEECAETFCSKETRKKIREVMYIKIKDQPFYI